jgi:hypothetical protein
LPGICNLASKKISNRFYKFYSKEIFILDGKTSESESNFIFFKQLAFFLFIDLKIIVYYKKYPKILFQNDCIFKFIPEEMKTLANLIG